MQVNPNPTRGIHADIPIEVARCSLWCDYFIERYCKIYDPSARDYIPFKLWQSQRGVLNDFDEHKQIIALKSRQIGMTWLSLAYALWNMLFRPQATILIFSRRDDEAIAALDRLKEMYIHLPSFLRFGDTRQDNAHIFQLPNKSIARAFPSNAGDSYSATLVIIDEASLIPNLDALMRSVKPTMDAGGKLIMLSRANKSDPNGTFAKLYRATLSGETGWHSIFLSWASHPKRDNQWYADMKQEIEARTGSLDELYEQYPSNETEALMSKSQDKRLPFGWVKKCYDERRPLDTDTIEVHKLSALAGVSYFVIPDKARHYVIGVDPAEGNPNSDDSAACVLDDETGEQVATIQGKQEPSVLAANVAILSALYNNAPIMCERNNHGHAVIMWLRDNTRATVLRGNDKHYGWQTNSASKAALYTKLADTLRDNGIVLHSSITYHQVCDIDGASLSAPQGQYDDMAMGLAIANIARGRGRATSAATINW